MALKVTKGQIWSGTISKIDVPRSITYVKNFILVSKTAQGWYYAALLIMFNFWSIIASCLIPKP